VFKIVLSCVIKYRIIVLFLASDDCLMIEHIHQCQEYYSLDKREELEQQVVLFRGQVEVE